MCFSRKKDVPPFFRIFLILFAFFWSCAPISEAQHSRGGRELTKSEIRKDERQREKQARKVANLMCKDYVALKRNCLNILKRIKDENSRDKAIQRFDAMCQNAEAREQDLAMGVYYALEQPRPGHVLHRIEKKCIVHVSQSTLRAYHVTLHETLVQEMMKQIYPIKYQKQVEKLLEELETEKQRLTDNNLMTDALEAHISLVEFDYIVRLNDYVYAIRKKIPSVESNREKW